MVIIKDLFNSRNILWVSYKVQFFLKEWSVYAPKFSEMIAGVPDSKWKIYLVCITRATYKNEFLSLLKILISLKLIRKNQGH